jgi:serine/threonine protein phosphatase PrpC
MLSAGCHSAANLRYRPTMEDRHYWEIDNTRAYFGVFDGHAGSGCASWCARNVHVYLDRNLSVFEEDKCLESVSTGMAVSRKMQQYI